MMIDEFVKDIEELNKKYPVYRPLWNRILRKIKNGDRSGALKTLRRCFGIAMSSGEPNIKNDIREVIMREHQR